MKDQNIIFIGQQDFDNEVGSNAVNMACEMSKNNRVIYINNALDRKTLKTKNADPKIIKKLKVRKGEEEGLITVSPTLQVFYPKVILESINWLPQGFVYDFFNKINSKKLSGEINALVDHLGWKEYILFNDCLISKTLYFNTLIRPKKYFYYIRDNFKPIPYFQKHAIKEQEIILGYVDAVFANSGFLAKYASQFNKLSFDIGQGCELDLYLKDNIQIASQLNHIEGVKIGYTGYLTSMRLDIDLILKIAEQRPQWQIVLVGPEDEHFKASKLHLLPNVHFLGRKAPEEMPNFISGFDVCFNPQLINELTEGNYPRKVDEYLAMGKPVVATKTDFMTYFADCTYLATNSNEFIEKIEVALEENSEQKQKQRIDIAKGHSWEDNVNKIYKVLKEKFQIT